MFELHMAIGREVRANLLFLTGNHATLATARSAVGSTVAANHSAVVEWLLANNLDVQAMRQHVHGVAYTPLVVLQDAYDRFMAILPHHTTKAQSPF